MTFARGGKNPEPIAPPLILECVRKRPMSILEIWEAIGKVCCYHTVHTHVTRMHKEGVLEKYSKDGWMNHMVYREKKTALKGNGGV